MRKYLFGLLLLWVVIPNLHAQRTIEFFEPDFDTQYCVYSGKYRYLLGEYYPPSYVEFFSVTAAAKHIYELEKKKSDVWNGVRDIVKTDKEIQQYDTNGLLQQLTFPQFSLRYCYTYDSTGRVIEREKENYDGRMEEVKTFFYNERYELDSIHLWQPPDNVVYKEAVRERNYYVWENGSLKDLRLVSLLQDGRKEQLAYHVRYGADLNKELDLVSNLSIADIVDYDHTKQKITTETMDVYDRFAAKVSFARIDSTFYIGHTKLYPAHESLQDAAHNTSANTCTDSVTFEAFQYYFGADGGLQAMATYSRDLGAGALGVASASNQLSASPVLLRKGGGNWYWKGSRNKPISTLVDGTIAHIHVPHGNINSNYEYNYRYYNRD